MESLEEIKLKIANSAIQFVSFDLFNTMVKTPFIRSEHLYNLLDKDYENKIYSNVCFHNMRINSEKVLFNHIKKNNWEREDFTLTKIYDNLHKIYGLENTICDFLKSKEINLLIHFTEQRKSIKELYQCALKYEKKIFIIADTYYDKVTIEKILIKNGYTAWTDIILASEFCKCKQTGELYKEMLKRYNNTPASWLHMGNNIDDDYNIPKKIGMLAVHIPKPVDLLLGNTTIDLCSELIDYTYLFNTMGFGCLIAIAANFYFDNPFRKFEIGSNLNGDPYFLGYYILGMHLIGIVKWIIKETTSYKRIIFLSRDGFLVKKAYDIIAEVYNECPQSVYMYISRKMMLPYIINTFADLLEFPSLNRKKACPMEVFELLIFCTKDSSIEEKKQFCNEIGIAADFSFGNIENYYKFINAYYERMYDYEKHRESQKVLETYFKTIKDGDITFDLGNFGRVQSALNRAANKKIDAMFLFSDSDKSVSETRKNKYKIKTFYDFYPNNHRSFREYILSSGDPSCIGAKILNKEVKLIFERKNTSLVSIKNSIHEGAIQFIKDFISLFGNYLEDIVFKTFEISLPFEAYLRKPCAFDLKIFEGVYFDKMTQKRDASIVEVITEMQSSFNNK